MPEATTTASPSGPGLVSFRSPAGASQAGAPFMEPMGEEEFAAAVKQGLADAVDYIDGFVAPQRAIATSFYRGDLFGNEQEGRSQFVMTELRDTVLAMLPSLLRIFCGSEQAVSFEPRTAAAVEIAEQATDYINYIFYNDNDGFTILYNAMKDALVRKSGVLKWRWDEDIEISEYRFTGLSDGALQMLVVDPEVDILEQTDEPLPDWQPPVDPNTGQPVPIPHPMVHDVRIRRHRKKSRVLVECVPTEELLVSRDGRDLPTCSLVAHRSLKTYSDLVKMGYDPEVLDNVSSGMGDTFMWNIEAQVRNPALNAFQQSPAINDESATKVVYNEAYIRIDKDGDGIAELHRVCMVGETVLHDEIVDAAPFAILCPDPEPHMIIGNSVADQTMDLQLLKSNVVRNTLDSLAQSIHPRTVVVEGQVNMDDVMNVETGAIVRARAVGMVQEMNTTFVGAQAMPIIAWLDEVKAKRTGVVPSAAGLDPDVLQSTTKSGVDATIAGAQERTEMTARLFAEGGIKQMMKGLLRLIVQHQDQPRMVRLRGKWVEVNPKVWDAEMDVIVHVALGRGTDQDRLMALNGIASKQEAAIQQAGLMNPLADLSKLRNTYAKMTELLGFKNVDEFFSPINMQQLAQQQQAQPPKPDANMVVAEAQAKKVEAQIAMDGQKLQHEQQRLQFEQQQAMVEAASKDEQRQLDAQLRREQMALEDARMRDQAQLDATIKLQGLELQFGTAVTASETEMELGKAGLLADVVKHRESLNRDEEAHSRDLHADLHKHRMTVEQKRDAAQLAADAKKEPPSAGNAD